MITGKLVATSSETGLSHALTRLIGARRRAADPQGRRYGDAADGRAVRLRPDHRRGAGQQPQTGSARLPLLLRHARRSGDHRRRCRRATFARTSRRSTPSARPPRGAASTKAPAFRSSFRRCIRAMRARRSERVMSELLPRCADAGAAGAPLRHRPEHRRRGSRPAGNLARSAGGAVLRRRSWPAGTASASWCRRTRSARPFVIDFIIDLARRSRHRLMVRLVKGAYWDTEIKRAQVDGLEGYPVLHAQGLHRRFVPRLRAEAAGGARRGVSAIRHAQRADAGGDPRDGGRQLLRRPVRVPVPARHGRAAVRGSRRAATS